MTLANEQLEAIRKRAEAATDGPWYWEEGSGTAMPSLVNASGKAVMDFGDCEMYYPTEGIPPNTTDEVFIAHAREDVPALLAEIERLNSKIKLYESLAEECDLYPILNEMGALDDDEA